MEFSAAARSLWSAWSAQVTDSASAARPFFDALDALLVQQALDPTITELFELDPPPADPGALYALVAHAQQWAQQQHAVQEDQPNRPLRAFLIGVPLSGPPEAMALEPDFWPLLESHLHERLTPLAQRRRGTPLTLGLVPFETVVHPEACAQLTLDGVRQVLDDLLEGSDDRLRRLQEDHERFEKALATHETVMVQRLGLAALILDPAQFDSTVDPMELLAQVDPTDAGWTADFSHALRYVFPPQDLTSAMTQALWFHLRARVDLARTERGLPLDDMQVAWANVEEDQAGVLSFVAEAAGQALPPIAVSGNWVSFIGPANVERTLGLWDEASEAEEEDPEGLEGPPVRRLH